MFRTAFVFGTFLYSPFCRFQIHLYKSVMDKDERCNKGLNREK